MANSDPDADGLRVEAAEQFGFEAINDDATQFICTEAELIAFAKACERAGIMQALTLLQSLGLASNQIERTLLGSVHTIDEELSPILEAQQRPKTTPADFDANGNLLVDGKPWSKTETIAGFPITWGVKRISPSAIIAGTTSDGVICHSCGDTGKIFISPIRGAGICPDCSKAKQQP